MSNILIESLRTLSGQLQVEIWLSDFLHAVNGHPEVTIEKIRQTLKKQGHFYFQRINLMNFHYTPEADLFYIYLESNRPNIQTRTNFDGIFKFVAKVDKNKIVGYEVENASKNLNFILTKFKLSSKEKLAICLYYIRINKKNTQEQIAELLQISLSKYKSLEKADHNINFDTLNSIFEKFPDETILETVFHKAS